MELLILIFVVVGYLVAVEIVGQAGDKRECGYWKAGFVAMFTSPIFGMLYVMSSKRKHVRYSTEILEEFLMERMSKEEERNGLIYGKFEPGKVDVIQASGNAKTKTQK